MVPAGRTCFDELGEAVGQLPVDSPRRGCLLVNCATGLAAHDAPAREVVEAYRTELSAAFRNALSEATDASEARMDERVRTLASLSMSAMLLARVNADESAALLSTAADHVRAWF
jgi:TetR/AcrR family transcriptional repressor of nem operon